MDSITSLEWQALLRAAIVFLIVLGGMFGIIIFVVKWQLGNLALGQATLFAKFNPGGEVHDLRADVEQIKRLMISTNPEDTLVLRAMTNTGKK